MKLKYKLIIISLCGFFTLPIYGKTDKTSTLPKLPKSPWSVKFIFGYVSNTGNTRNNNVLSGFKIRYTKKKWEAGINTQGQYSSDKGGTTAQNFSALGDDKYYFIPKHFLFNTVNYRYDKFSPYWQTTAVVIGYGWDVFKTKKLKFILQLGPGYRHQQETTTEKNIHDITANFIGDLVWQISKNAKFSQKLSVETGTNTTYTESNTALSTKIIGNLAAEVSLFIKHYSSVPPLSTRKYNTDTTTSVALVYKF